MARLMSSNSKLGQLLSLSFNIFCNMVNACCRYYLQCYLSISSMIMLHVYSHKLLCTMMTMLMEFMTKSLAYLFSHCNISSSSLKNVYYIFRDELVLEFIIIMLSYWCLSIF